MARSAGEHMGSLTAARYRDIDESRDGVWPTFGLPRPRTSWWFGRRRPLFRATVSILLVLILGAYYSSSSSSTQFISNSADYFRSGTHSDTFTAAKYDSIDKLLSHDSDDALRLARPHDAASSQPDEILAAPVLLQPPSDPQRASAALNTRPSKLQQADETASADTLAPREHHSCASISSETLSELQLATEPTIRVMSQDKVVSEYSSIDAPAPICILVAIPQTNLPEQNYTDAPVPGRGPDTIHLYLDATDVVVTFPPLDPLPGQPEASNLHITRGHSIVYYADTVLYTAGKYNIIAEQEFNHWYWAQEWNVAVVAIDPVTGFPNTSITTTTGAPPGALYDTHFFDPRPLPRASITVSGSKSLPPRPPCSDAVNAGVGRWYKQSSFPTALAEEMADEWGYTWQGDFCHLRHFTPAETLQCFENKSIQFYGDSMTRRILKAIISGGDWCHDLKDDCQDADDGADGMIDTLDVDTVTGELVHHFTPRGSRFQAIDRSAIKFGRNSSAYYSFLTQLGHWPGDWMDRLYDASDLVVLKELGGPENNETTNRGIKPGAFSHARPPSESGTVDLVVMGFGAWDQAFTDRFDTYENQLAEFRDAMITAYSTSERKTPMILRMSNSWCCRGTENSFRRYTGGRICEFDSRTKKIFNYTSSGDAVDGRIMVVDPINMNGRADVLRDYPPSAANHPRASHVRLEMQMLMNSVCVKDGTSGMVSLRS